MKKHLLILLLLPALAGCYKAKRDYLATALRDFSDGFETYATAADLISEDRWPGNQLTLADNSISIDTVNVHSGNQSLRCEAGITIGDVVSKASLLNNNFGFEQGDEIYFEAWYFVNSSNPPNLFLADFEENANISLGPGFRLLINENGGLCIERKKMGKSTLQQTISTPRALPLGQWVRIQLEVKLAKRNKGYFKLWQNDELILEHNNVQTLPRDMIYVTQGTAGLLRQLEVGITANGSNQAATVWVDDVVIRLR